MLDNVSVSATPTRIVINVTGRIRYGQSTRVDVADYSGNRIAAESFITAGRNKVSGIFADLNNIYLLRSSDLTVFSYSGVETTGLGFTLDSSGRSMQIERNVLYVITDDTLSAYSLVVPFNYHTFIAFQFDTVNFNDVYIF